MRKTVNMGDKEPEQMFLLPSENIFHIFSVVEIKEDTESNPDIIRAKLKVMEGEEAGRTILHRMDTDENSKVFWVTRLFLKAIGEPYKGTGISMDSDRWFGQELTATVTHSKDGKFANISEYRFDEETTSKAKDTTPTAQETATWAGEENQAEKEWDEDEK